MPILTAQDYGTLYGSSASPAIAQQITAEGRFVLPPGTFKVQDPLPMGGLGGASYGAGKEVSRLVANNMAGTSVIKQPTAGQYARHNYRDFGIVGDGTVFDGVTSACDHAMDWTLSAGMLLYESSFRDLSLASMGSAFFAPVQFNTLLERVDAWSMNGHCFELQGGNTTVLQACYAHKVGAGKAAYRIRCGAALIACNGVDELTNDCRWGHFGDATTGHEAVYRVTMLKCNVEDWGANALALEYTGTIKIDDTTFLARSAGTYEGAIKALNGDTHYIEMGIGATFLSKGATRTETQEMIAAGMAGLRVRSHTNLTPSPWHSYKRQGDGLTYKNAEDVVTYSSYLTNAMTTNA